MFAPGNNMYRLRVYDPKIEELVKDDIALRRHCKSWSIWTKRVLRRYSHRELGSDLMVAVDESNGTQVLTPVERETHIPLCAGASIDGDDVDLVRALEALGLKRETELAFWAKDYLLDDSELDSESESERDAKQRGATNEPKASESEIARLVIEPGVPTYLLLRASTRERLELILEWLGCADSTCLDTGTASMHKVVYGLDTEGLALNFEEPLSSALFRLPGVHDECLYRNIVYRQSRNIVPW